MRRSCSGSGILALFIEFKLGGFGLLGVAGVVLLALVFLGSYVAGLSGHEPVLLFALGVVLLALELLFFHTAGFLGVVGVALMLGSLLWSMADLWPNEPITVAWSADAFARPLANLGMGLAIAIGLGAVLLRFLPHGWIWDRLVVSATVGGAAQIASVEPGAAAGPRGPGRPARRGGDRAASRRAGGGGRPAVRGEGGRRRHRPPGRRVVVRGTDGFQPDRRKDPTMSLILLLFLVGIGLLAADVFVSSFLLAACGAVAMLAGSVVAYGRFGPFAAAVAAVAGLVLLGGTIYVELVVLPKTRFGRGLVVAVDLRGRQPAAARLGRRSSARRPRP